QMSLALGKPSRLNNGDMQQLGSKMDVIDVIGVHGEAIWLVQVVTEKRMSESVLDRIGGQGDVISQVVVFEKPKIKGPALQALGVAHRQMRLAFPDVPIVTCVLVLHPTGPDFELYDVTMPSNLPTEIVLEEGSIRKN